jgi:presqualene diphosphate synthase
MSVVEAAAPPPTAQTRASGSSFYAAMRILPRAQREGMFEVYSFCRLVDDIADDGGPQAPRLQQLEQWRQDITALCTGKIPAPQFEGLAAAIKEFNLQKDDFFAVIDGMEMDVREDIQAPDWQTLDLYCDRVASAVGRLSVRVFGVPEKEGAPLAHHLGRALQMTNILRDLDEDAEINRLYLPREALVAAGIMGTKPNEVLASPRLAAACAPVIARAKEHFAEAAAIMKRCPRASVKSPRLMYEAYQIIFGTLLARGFAPPRAKIKLPKHQLLLALLRYGLF